MEIINNQIKVEPPKRPKNITGTRLASILGMDRWNTDFKTWCAITRTYEEPFTGNKYTRAGEVIEPKVINYLKTVYNLNIRTPEDVYGEDPFKETWGNFFPGKQPFGGMWDSLLLDDDGKIIGVIEIKTTKRAEDWVNGAPDHYAIQACLYAYLLGVEKIIMTASFLEEMDYVNPENFEPSAENTILDTFNLYERYPYFDKYIESTLQWWEEHVVTGLSPEFDERKDKEILDILTTKRVDKSIISDIIGNAETLQMKLDKVKESVKEDEKKLKKLKDQIRDYAKEEFGETDNKVTIEGEQYEWTITKSERVTVDRKALEEDGLLDKYSTVNESYRLTLNRRGNDGKS